MGAYEEKKETCGTICLKYLLFTFNFLFWLAGGVVMAVGVWTLVEKSDYISLLSSKTYAVSAYILVLAGAIVMVTGVLGCCATFKEQRSLLRVLNEELKQNLKETLITKYQQNTHEQITSAVDKLQQETYILEHLKIIGAVGVGVACVQIIGMVFTCCLYQKLKAEPY
ncbi:unnamed protein product [Menidia menidia]|uniref:(Atlantic silverside) hypothetical protein n=1 Tax=Menidia menidia TaxID=238744 RepID=A0A8S4A7J0_9TELE|nr:unnamed protein product [Menidia menidia]